MRTSALVCLSLLSGVTAIPGTVGPAIAAGETYRWVDEHGVVNYGEKAPAGRQAHAVNVQPAGTVESHALPAWRASEPPTVPAAEPSPRGMDFATYIRLQPGMSEGEVLLRAGRPDYVTVENTRDVAKSLYYYPTAANPWLTVVHIRGGRVADIERNRKTN